VGWIRLRVDNHIVETARRSRAVPLHAHAVAQDSQVAGKAASGCAGHAPW
jgi:hypothetical protein